MSARRAILIALPFVIVVIMVVFFSMTLSSLPDQFSRELTRRIATGRPADSVCGYHVISMGQGVSIRRIYAGVDDR